MNKSILIVICDFLLLSLLASARFDKPSANVARPDKIEYVEQANTPPQAEAPASSSPNPRFKDLVDTMKMTLDQERTTREQIAAALEQERSQREQLAASLETEKQTRQKTSEALSTKERELLLQRQLAARQEREIREARLNLQQKEEEARRIEQARAALATQFSQTQTNLARLQQQLSTTESAARASQERLLAVQAEFAAAQSNLATVQKELSSTSAEAKAARERVEHVQAELKKREVEAQQAREQAQKVEQARLQAEVARERLAGQLKVAETEQKLTQQQLLAASNQIHTVQKEKQQLQAVTKELAQGVVQFAEKQGELAKEIREHRPLTPHTIFSQFITNRVEADFRATRSGLFGRTISKQSQTKTVLVTDGKQTYALFHVEETPLRFEEMSADWERFVGQLFRYDANIAVRELHFLALDPRIAAAPLTEAQAKQLQATVYKVVADPYRFHEALLIGADEGYYGECQFKIDADNPQYIRMDRSMFGKLVGKFNPSRGDLVFSKSGELLGMMVNERYCALMTSFAPTGIVQTGTAVKSAETLNRMHLYVSQMPESMR